MTNSQKLTYKQRVRLARAIVLNEIFVLDRAVNMTRQHINRPLLRRNQRNNK
jgi:hypothetical protein